MHEIIHALGSSHEHQRADRDEHLNVDFTHVSQQQMANFELDGLPEWTHLNTPYDYSSIMHYPSRVGFLICYIVQIVEGPFIEAKWI